MRQEKRNLETKSAFSYKALLVCFDENDAAIMHAQNEDQYFCQSLEKAYGKIFEIPYRAAAEADTNHAKPFIYIVGQVTPFHSIVSVFVAA